LRWATCRENTLLTVLGKHYWFTISHDFPPYFEDKNSIQRILFPTGLAVSVI
jgi:hypothetical protein